MRMWSLPSDNDVFCRQIATRSQQTHTMAFQQTHNSQSRFSRISFRFLLFFLV
jgi:hypothetical protein